MIGDDATGKDNESRTPEPIAPESLSRSATSFADTEIGRSADSPWSPVPAGRRISFTAWGIAAILGILLWVVIIKLA